MNKIFIFIIIVFIVLKSNGQEKTPKFSSYINIGQSIPIGNYSSSSKSNNPIEIGKTDLFGQSINWGIDYYIKKHIGLTAGLFLADYSLDNNKFEHIHNKNQSYTESYLQEHNLERYYFGITTRLMYKNLFIEPRFALGYTVMDFGIADFYQKNYNNEIYKTINYDYKSSSFISYNLGINFNYKLINWGRFQILLPLFIEFSYQNPNIEYKQIISNKIKETIETNNYSYKQKIMTLNYNFGIMIKL